jgi:hypothetical protein
MSSLFHHEQDILAQKEITNNLKLISSIYAEQ